MLFLMAAMEAQQSQVETSEENTAKEKHLNAEEHGCQDTETSNDRESSAEPISSNKSDVSHPTENDIIDVDDIELSDEDSWLYTSPKKLTREQKDENLYKWLRKDVEDLENVELQMAKMALVSKLDELDILSSQTSRKTKADVELQEKQVSSEEVDQHCDTPSKLNCSSSESSLQIPSFKENANLISACPEENGTSNLTSEESCSPGSADLDKKLLLSESRPLNSVTDVCEIARLQEESLRQSSSKLLNLSESRVPNRSHLAASESERKQRLMMKPASVEALHKYNGRQSPPAIVSLGGTCRTVKCSPQSSPFGSTLSLDYPSDVHRSSLPNLNRGYYSLRPKKSKRPSEPRIQCPLPVYPVNQKLHVNGSVSQTDLCPVQKGSGRSHNSDYREIRTLPSSYRIKSQKPPVCKKEHLSNAAARRESAPSPLSINSNIPSDQHRRERTPNSVRCVDVCYPKRQVSSPSSRVMSPVSPRVNGGLLINHSQQQHGSSPSLHGSSRSPSLNNIYGAKELSHSHSPCQSPALSGSNKQDGLTSSNQPKDSRKLSLPSKIPSPFVRSGIPVPSSQHKSRSSPAEDTWSEGCF